MAPASRGRLSFLHKNLRTGEAYLLQLYGDSIRGPQILAVSGQTRYRVVREGIGMGIVQLPAGRLSGSAERMALSRGLARPTGSRSLLKVLSAGAVTPAFCATCAAPIDFGAVWRGEEVFCSVECSLGGNRPA